MITVNRGVQDDHLNQKKNLFKTKSQLTQQV